MMTRIPHYAVGKNGYAAVNTVKWNAHVTINKCRHDGSEMQWDAMQHQLFLTETSPR